MVKPLILMAFGARDEAENLPKYFEQIDNLDYPKDRLRYAAFTSDSKDETVELVLDYLKSKKDSWWHHSTYDQYPLRKRMFTQGNYVRYYALADLPNTERISYVFHCDADITHIPPETLETLVKLDVDVVAPYVYIDPEDNHRNSARGKKIFRDVWGYRFKHGPHSGLMFNHSVPDYYKRNYLTDDSIKADKVRHLIPMQSVGSNPVLIKREALERVPWYDGLHAFPGWCIHAQRYGVLVWSYPLLECLHDWREIF